LSPGRPPPLSAGIPPQPNPAPRRPPETTAHPTPATPRTSPVGELSSLAATPSTSSPPPHPMAHRGRRHGRRTELHGRLRAPNREEGRRLLDLPCLLRGDEGRSAECPLACSTSRTCSHPLPPPAPSPSPLACMRRRSDRRAHYFPRWRRPTDTEEGHREVGSSMASTATQIEIEDDHLPGCVPGGDKGAGLQARDRAGWLEQVEAPRPGEAGKRRDTASQGRRRREEDASGGRRWR
jgi:hypothetical protein